MSTEIPDIPPESATIADGVLRGQLEDFATSHGSPLWLRRQKDSAKAAARDAAVLMLFEIGRAHV